MLTATLCTHTAALCADSTRSSITLQEQHARRHRHQTGEDNKRYAMAHLLCSHLSPVTHPPEGHHQACRMRCTTPCRDQYSRQPFHLPHHTVDTCRCNATHSSGASAHLPTYTLQTASSGGAQESCSHSSSLCHLARHCCSMATHPTHTAAAQARSSTLRLLPRHTKRGPQPPAATQRRHARADGGSDFFWAFSGLVYRCSHTGGKKHGTSLLLLHATPCCTDRQT